MTKKTIRNWFIFVIGIFAILLLVGIIIYRFFLNGDEKSIIKQLIANLGSFAKIIQRLKA